MRQWLHYIGHNKAYVTILSARKRLEPRDSSPLFVVLSSFFRFLFCSFVFFFLKKPKELILLLSSLKCKVNQNRDNIRSIF